MVWASPWSPPPAARRASQQPHHVPHRALQPHFYSPAFPPTPSTNPIWSTAPASPCSPTADGRSHPQVPIQVWHLQLALKLLPWLPSPAHIPPDHGPHQWCLLHGRRCWAPSVGRLFQAPGTPFGLRVTVVQRALDVSILRHSEVPGGQLQPPKPGSPGCPGLCPCSTHQASAHRAGLHREAGGQAVGPPGEEVGWLWSRAAPWLAPSGAILPSS